MKKIGIITFHFSINYGSALQVYALSNFLENNNCNVEIINYRPEYHTLQYCLFENPFKFAKRKCRKKILYPMFFVLGLCKNLLRFRPYKLNKKKKFENFLSLNINQTNKFNTLEEIEATGYTHLIAGSDQIWNYVVTKHDPAYFLSFANRFQKKIAYSASAQAGKIDLDHSSIKLIKNFDHISVREDSLSQSLKKYGINDSIVTIDPTLLLDKEEYQKIENTNIKNKDYILIYNLEGAYSDKLYEIINILNKANKCQIINISPKKVKIKCKNILNCGPEEFLKYIHNAKYVVTNSFHAVVFSIIYNKEFYCVLRDPGDKRVPDLLKALDLEYRIYTDKENFDGFANEINYCEVMKNLNKLREKSIKYINEVIK